MDIFPFEGITVCDLANCRTQPLPFPDDSAEEMLASHLIEHIPDPLAMMQELHRVAKPGCKATFLVPHGGSDDAWEDPTHVRPYYLGSFGYFGQPWYWRADYNYRGDWKVNKIVLRVSQEAVAVFGKERLVEAMKYYRNIVSEMTVEMTAIKPIRECRRDLQTLPEFVVSIG